MWLGGPGETDLEATIKIPDGYNPELPKARDITRDFAEFHASYELDKGVLTAKRRLVLKLREVPVSEFEEYKSFRKALEDEQNQYIVLTARDSSAPLKPNPASGGNAAFALPDSDNRDAMRAESQMQAQPQMHDLARAMESLRRAVAADPGFTRAWALLAELYMDLGRPEESIEALHRAIDSDPKSPIPLRLLASALTGRYGHPDEAIKAWQELLKLTPQDYNAIQILGGLFIRQKRFPEAISLLDAAAKQNPNNADLQLSLGKTYLLSGNPEKAISEFDAALKLRPGAAMKNEIGYALADANVKLPEALQDAKEVVQEEETASRDVHLEKLEVDDLGHTRLLAAYWDTLGWVYFRMANLGEAETYLFAAFHLSQDATIADHLGQVYEQEHKQAGCSVSCVSTGPGTDHSFAGNPGAP